MYDLSLAKIKKVVEVVKSMCMNRSELRLKIKPKTA